MLRFCLIDQSRQPHHDERQDDDPQLGEHPQEDPRPPRTISSATNNNKPLKQHQTNNINKQHPTRPTAATFDAAGSDTHIRGFGTGATFFWSFPFPTLPPFFHPATISFVLSTLRRLFFFFVSLNPSIPFFPHLFPSVPVVSFFSFDFFILFPVAPRSVFFFFLCASLPH